MSRLSLVLVCVAQCSALQRDPAADVNQLSAALGSEKANKFMSTVERLSKDKLHGMLLWKDGQMVYENYWDTGVKQEFYINMSYSNPRENAHFLGSVTKTLTGLSVMRAVQMGLLVDLKKPVADFFPGLNRSKIVPGAEQITIEDCMSMRSGLQVTQAEWQVVLYGVEHMLSHTKGPVAHDSVVLYQSADVQLLWNVIEKVYPNGAKEFLMKEVLGPLGIQPVAWDLDENGVPLGSSGGNLRAADMIKIGRIILNNGEWNGKQFVPQSYIDCIKSPMLDFHDYRCLWHHSVDGYPYSAGFAGQYILVHPEQDLVMVTIAGNDDIMGDMMPLFDKIAMQ